MKNDEELKSKIYSLINNINAGNVHIAEGVDIFDDFKAIKFDENGEVDLSTVSKAIRLMATTATYMLEREELKRKFSLEDIQYNYFEGITNIFEPIWNDFKDAPDASPWTIAKFLSSNEEQVKHIYSNIQEIYPKMIEFWEKWGDIVIWHIEDLKTSFNGSFGGDLFPPFNTNIASQCGIYLDTIILPDPFIRSILIFNQYSPKDQVYYFIKHGLNLLKYKNIVNAKTKTPILIIAPDLDFISTNKQDQYERETVEKYVTQHSNILFNEKFNSFTEFADYCNEIYNYEDFESKVSDLSKFIIDSDDKRDLKTQLIEKINSEKDMLGTDHFGAHIETYIYSRIGKSYEIAEKSFRLNATPIIAAPTSWKYYNWFLEYEFENNKHKLNLKDQYIMHSMQHLSNDQMQWLGSIPPDALIEIRENDGALDEIRSIISSGLEEIPTKIDTDPTEEISTQIKSNIDNAFVQHKANIERLTAKQWKFAGKTLTSLLTHGAVQFCACAISPYIGIASIPLSAVLPIPTSNKFKEFSKEKYLIQRSNLGKLFKQKDNSENR